jgi:hypothetical protein
MNSMGARGEGKKGKSYSAPCSPVFLGGPWPADFMTASTISLYNHRECTLRDCERRFKGGAGVMAEGERVGEVTHYFNKISVAVLDLSKDLKLGDMVHFLGRNTDFEQRVGSMQIEHEDIEAAGAGDDVAVKVIDRVRPGDSVFRLTEE